MNVLNNRKVKYGVLAAFIVAVVAYATGMTLFYANKRNPARSLAALPPEGVSRYDTNGLVPGNPKNGERQLKHLYAMYQTYKKLHGGEMPGDFLTLMSDCWSQRRAYGFTSNEQINEYLKNPDQQYDDDESQRNHSNSFSFGSSKNRVDGTPTFSSKPAGTRDLVAYSTTYLHRNERNFPGERQTINPVGYYQVLWDDGQVEQVPYDKALFAYVNGKSGFDVVFKGQAGIGDQVRDYDTHWRETMHWSVPPHGSAGGKGASYNGQVYR